MSHNYYRRQNSRQSVSFCITLDRNKIETCGFHHSIAKAQEHLLIGKIVCKEKSEGQFLSEFSRNHVQCVRTATAHMSSASFHKRVFVVENSPLKTTPPTMSVIKVT